MFAVFIADRLWQHTETWSDLQSFQNRCEKMLASSAPATMKVKPSYNIMEVAIVGKKFNEDVNPAMFWVDEKALCEILKN